MKPGELTRRQLFTETFPKMGVAALALSAQGEPPPIEQGQFPTPEETVSRIIDGEVLEDPFSRRSDTARVILEAVQSYSPENAPGAISIEYSHEDEAYHRLSDPMLEFPALFCPKPGTIRINPDAATWTRKTIPQLQMELFIHATDARFQASDPYAETDIPAADGINIIAAWGGRMLIQSGDGEKVYGAFAQGIQCMQGIITLLKQTPDQNVQKLIAHISNSLSPLPLYRSVLADQIVTELKIPKSTILTVFRRNEPAELFELLNASFNTFVTDTNAQKPDHSGLQLLRLCEGITDDDPIIAYTQLLQQQQLFKEMTGQADPSEENVPPGSLASASTIERAQQLLAACSFAPSQTAG